MTSIHEGEGEVVQSCPTLCDPVDCNLLGFSVHGILQARILEWVAISFSRWSSQPRDQTQVSHIGGRRFNLWATREANESISTHQSYGFSSSHVWIWELDHKKGWAAKNWCFWTVVLEKTLESPLERKEIKPVNPKGNLSWLLIGRTDAKVETPILWPHDGKNWLIWKGPDAGKEWKQEEKGMTEDEIVGWYHWLDGHEFEQAPGVGDGQGGLACYSPWSCKESDMTEWLNWTELNQYKRKVETL